MPNLNLEKATQTLKSDSNSKRIRDDHMRFMLYSGKLRETVEQAISSEFKTKKNITEMIHRIVPLNITHKIVDKLAKIYTQQPIRNPAIKNDNDSGLISLYADSMNIDSFMKYSNELFKLHKHVLLQPYLDSTGIPRLRIIPSQQFTLVGIDPINPERPTAVIIHLKPDEEKDEDKRFAYWDEEFHYIIDGKGDIVQDEMIAMGNPEGINPFGVLPFVHINESLDMLIPISDDDLKAFNVIICVLLTDLCFGLKYQTWSVFYIIGAKERKIEMGPAATIELPFDPETGNKPEVGTVKPDMDSDKMLTVIEFLVASLLSTKNLSAGQVSGKLDVKNAASGVSKLLDQAESMEDRNDQIDFFRTAEEKLWDLLANNMLPYWVESKKIHSDYTGVFSSDFELSIIYPEQKIILSVDERIRVQVLKLKNGLTTLKRALQEINPDLDGDEIDELIKEIQTEKADNANFIIKNLGENGNDKKEPDKQKQPASSD